MHSSISLCYFGLFELTNYTGESMDLELEENSVTKRMVGSTPLMANCVVLQTGF